MAGGRDHRQQTYDWPAASTYVQNPPYFQGMTQEPREITNIEGRQGSGGAGRYDHDRPHLPGRVFQRHHPAGNI